MSMQNSKAPTKNIGQCAIEGNSIKSEYAVGRGRPPLHSRFKKGQSGNPNGRPAGHRI